MEPYFIWKGVDSRSLGIVVTSYPPIIRPEERVVQHVIPGRSGTLTTTEGRKVYNAYLKPFVIGLRPGADAQAVIHWLQGDGVAIFGNEPEFAYRGRIIGAIQFDKIGTWEMKSAGVQLYTQPLKARAVPDGAISIAGESAEVFNPGEVESAPLITLSASGPVALSAGETSMEFENLSGAITIDCDAEIILDSAGELYAGKWAGRFLRIPTGRSVIALDGQAQLTMDPRWRWI